MEPLQILDFLGLDLVHLGLSGLGHRRDGGIGFVGHLLDIGWQIGGIGSMEEARRTQDECPAGER